MSDALAGAQKCRNRACTLICEVSFRLRRRSSRSALEKSPYHYDVPSTSRSGCANLQLAFWSTIPRVVLREGGMGAASRACAVVSVFS